MDASFYRERAEQVRDLAERADPFIRRRLLDLANSYDQKASGKPTAGTKQIPYPQMIDPARRRSSEA
ncbi:hypothetical protein ACVIGB_000487 [Bradyrhizobium sp. USDA 4341]